MVGEGVTVATNRAELILAGKDDTKAAFAGVGASLDRLSAKVNGFAGKLGGIAGAAGLAVTAFRALEGIQALTILDQLDDLSEKTGFTVESLSALRFAGEATGTNFEALTGGIGRLSKQMAEAAGGGKEAQATFTALGVSVKNADGTLRSAEDVLGDVATRFASYEDGAAKAALAQRLFGKSGAEMIPLLNQGAEGVARLRKEAGQLGAIYSGDLAKDAAAFNDNLLKLKISAEAAAVAISGPLIAALGRMSTELLEGRKTFGSYFNAFVEIGVKSSPFDSWSDGAKKAEGDVKRLADEIAKLESGRRGMTENAGGAAFVSPGGTARSASRLAAAKAELDSAQKRKTYFDSLIYNSTAAEARRLESAYYGGTTQAPVTPSGGGGSKEKVKDLEAATKNYLESLDKQLEKTKELSQVEIGLAEIQRIRADGGVVTESMKQQILLRAASIDAIKEQEKVEKERDRDREASQRQILASQDEVRQIFDSVRTPLETYSAELTKLNGLYDTGFLSIEVYNRALLKQGEAFEEAQKRANDAANKQDDYAKRAAQNIQDSIGTGLADLMDGNFKSIGDGFTKMLNRMVAEALAADLSRSLFGGLVDGGSGEGLFGGVFKQFSGSMFGGSSKAGDDVLGSFLKTNNNFGSVAGGAGFGDWFGSLLSFDKGTDWVPEDMIAKIHKGERIVPAAQNRPGYAGGVNQTNQFILEGKVDRSTQEQIARKLRRQQQQSAARFG